MKKNQYNSLPQIEQYVQQIMFKALYSKEFDLAHSKFWFYLNVKSYYDQH